MAKPVLVVVDDENTALQALTRELQSLAAAVGEGSTTIRLIHDYLALAPPRATSGATAPQG
jgi:hypothetical protein